MIQCVYFNKVYKFWMQSVSMVFDNLKKHFLKSDEKYEILLYKYSQVKLENKKLKEGFNREINSCKDASQKKIVLELIEIYKNIETVKEDSFKVKSIDPNVQRMFVDLNTLEKNMKDLLLFYNIEEIEAKERFYDPDVHEVASYEDARGMQKGIIIKTAKKGFKHKNVILSKPKVVVTK